MRTDPLTDDGRFDTEFFASHEYEAEQKNLIQYLKTEGFDLKEEDFVIDFRSRRWHVTFNQSKK